MKRLLSIISSEVGRRFQRVFSAQLLNQFATIAVQLGLVPVLLLAWGKQTYGVWLVLSAIPSYLTLSDLGFTLIAKNEMLIHTSAGRRDEALRTFHSVFALLNVIAPTVLAVCLGVLLFVNPGAVLKLGAYSSKSAILVMSLLLVNVLAYQYFLLICGGVRCENRLATETTWGACSRLMEGVVVGATALLGGGLVVAAAGTLINRLVFSAALYLWLRRASPWLYLGHRFADWKEIRRLIKPAFAFMLMPLSQSLLIQAPLLIIGALLGPVSVVTFSTTRTLTRLGTAGTNMLNGALQGEYGVAFARGNASGLRRIFRYHQLSSLVMVLCYGATLYLLRVPLMRIFTHGKVPVLEPFFTLMFLAVAAEMMWSSIATPLSSVNRHVRFAHALLVVCVLGVGLCYGLTTRFGIVGAAMALFAIHSVTIAICYSLRHNVGLATPRVPSVVRS